MFGFFRARDRAFVVYQMGKVGSATFKNSLERMYGKKRVLHTHHHEEAHDCITQWSRRFDAVVVITGFREPASRCMSAYFHNLTDAGNPWFVGTREDVMGRSVDWLISDYNRKVGAHVRTLVGPWLKNYERVTGCRPTDFSRCAGCLKASVNNVHLYVYTLEHLSSFQQGMEDDPYLGGVRLVSTNVSEEKWYAGIYRDFKRRYRISRNEYDELYGQIDYVRWLYDDQEIRHLTKGFVTETQSAAGETGDGKSGSEQTPGRQNGAIEKTGSVENL